MRPLEGVRIIDLTVAVAGPVATHILGDLGAEVIRVEPPFARPTAHLDVSAPAPYRHGDPLAHEAEDRPYNRLVGYNELHRSKRGMTIDLSMDAGRDTLLRLVAVSDAVIENMSPRVLPSLGLGYEALRAAKRDIVLVSMPAFGLSGPLRDRVSYGPGVDAMSGLAHLTGYPDRGPMNAANYFCDYNAGALAAFAALAALRYRDITGKGQHVELAMIEGELQLIGEALLDYTMNGRVQRRMANAHPSMAPHGAYPCAGRDRWLAIACEDDAQWAALCGVLGAPHLVRDERFADVVSRVRHAGEIDAIVATWTRDRDANDAMRALQHAGVPAGAVQDLPDLQRDSQLRHRGWLQPSLHPEAGEILHTRVAFTLSRTPSPIERPAPVFAQDNDYVLRELLGMGDDEVSSLEATHVIRRTPPHAKG